MLEVQFSHALPLLKDLDLATILKAQVAGSDTEDPAQALEALTALGQMASTKVFRRLAAIAALTPEQLFDSESTPKIMVDAERAQALRPFQDVMRDAVGFFQQFGLSFSGMAGSSGSAEGQQAETREETRDGSHAD